MKELISIVAIADNNVIGYQGMIPWRIPEDLKRFKRVTMGHPIIMGRKTYESIGKPLPGRRNLVLSTQKNFLSSGVEVYKSLDECLRTVGDEKTFIIGGGSLFEETMDIIDKLDITRVHLNPPGDTYFPEIKPTNWKLDSSEDHGIFSYQTYIRKSYDKGNRGNPK
jgi:dihydrofolate reductase